MFRRVADFQKAWEQERGSTLKVPGVYGPAREEWTTYGMQPPTVYGSLGARGTEAPRDDLTA